MRYVLGIILGLLIAGVGFRVYQLRQERQAGAAGARGGLLAVSVSVGFVEQTQLRDVGRFYGSLEPRYRFTIAPKITGRLTFLDISAGDAVENGRLIAKIDADELELAVAESEAALTVANATLAQSRSAVDTAQRKYDRQKKLHDDLVVTIQELEEYENDLTIKKAVHRLNEANIVRQQAALDAARVRLGYATINATWDPETGNALRYVGERFVDEGALLRVNDPICTVLDTAVLTAVLDVPERSFPRLTAGMPVAIKVGAWPGVTFPGTLRVRPSELSSSSRQARVEVDVPNAERKLAPGMFAESEVVFEIREAVPTLPVAAVVTRDEKQGVYVVEEDAEAATGAVVMAPPAGTEPAAAAPMKYRAKFVPVVAGLRADGRVEIISPEITAPVVVLGQNRLIEDTPVNLDERSRQRMDARAATATTPEAPEAPVASEAPEAPSEAEKEGVALAE